MTPEAPLRLTPLTAAAAALALLFAAALIRTITPIPRLFNKRIGRRHAQVYIQAYTTENVLYTFDNVAARGPNSFLGYGHGQVVSKDEYTPTQAVFLFNNLSLKTATCQLPVGGAGQSWSSAPLWHM